MKLSIEELKRLQSIHIMDLKREELANAEEIVIDTEKSPECRMESYIEQTGNPFAQNVGAYILQVGYAEDTKDTVDDCLILLTKRKIQIIV